MKALLAICMLVASTFVWAGDNPASAQPDAVRGEVLEVRNVEEYTYLRLKTKGGETWAAVTRAAVKKGETVTIENVTVMNNFESKSLKKTFPTILFGSLGGAPGNTAISKGEMAAVTTAHSGLAKTDDSGAIRVPKATGPNAHTVAEIMTKGAALKDKTVLVRGKVVKFNAGIMGKNWVHLHDGTGSAADKTNDLLVTTMGQAKVGDVVTAKGVVRTDKDFGAGYSYKVLVEDATLQQ